MIPSTQANTRPRQMVAHSPVRVLHLLLGFVIATIFTGPTQGQEDDPFRAAQQTLQAWGKLHDGGVWVPSFGGTEHRYRWIHNGRFLKYTTKDDNSLTGIIGIDPRTNQVTWWCFYEQGGVSTSVMQQEQPDVWTIRLQGKGRCSGF
jgi:hypothetical protein